MVDELGLLGLFSPFISGLYNLTFLATAPISPPPSTLTGALPVASLLVSLFSLFPRL